MRQSTKALNFVAGTLGAQKVVTQDSLTQAMADFGVTSILTGDTYYNTAADGQPPTLTQLWSNSFIWVGRAGQSATTSKDGVGVPSLGGAGLMLYWEGFSPGGVPSTDKDSTSFEGGNYVESYPDLTIDAMVLRLKMSSYPYVGNARAGDLINPQYS